MITSKKLVVGVSTSTFKRSTLKSPIKNIFLFSEQIFSIKGLRKSWLNSLRWMSVNTANYNVFPVLIAYFNKHRFKLF